MKGIIDPFVGHYAVVEFEGRRMVGIHKRELPTGLKEGDAIRGSDGGLVIIKPSHKK